MFPELADANPKDLQICSYGLRLHIVKEEKFVQIASLFACLIDLLLRRISQPRIYPSYALRVVPMLAMPVRQTADGTLEI
jgi:hypothetical protein